MVSMKDIAKACGVSVATVSKALSGQPDIGEQTRELICRTADSLGYMTNSAARALKTNRTYNIGVLFVDERRSGLAHEYFSAVLESLKVEAEANGYDITFINRNVGKKATTYLQHCQYRGVDGVVIACVDFNDPQVLELVNSRLPVVTIDHVFNNRAAVVSDNVRGMEELVRYVYAKGHRRIAFIHGERTTVTENRLTGFYRACDALGLEIPEEYVREGVYHDPDRCAELTRELLQLPEPPTCILMPDDFSSIGGGNAIRRRRQRGGLRRHPACKRYESGDDYLSSGYGRAWQDRCREAHRTHRKAAYRAGRSDPHSGQAGRGRLCPCDLSMVLSAVRQCT